PGAAGAGALVGYSRNYLDDSTTLQAEGAILTVRRGDRGRWKRAVVPSLSFKRIDIDQGDEDSDDGEVDELAGRVSLHALLANEESWGHELKAGFAYLTDFDLDQRIGAVELDWRPIRAGTCLGNARGEFKLRCGFGVRLEGGRIFESRDLSGEDEDFLRVGPVMSVQISKDAWTFGLRWLYRFELEGDLGDSDLLRADLNIALDDTERWSLSVAYEDGELPLSLTPARTLVVGLGIKY
ncbi:MAG: hypothetical protein AAGF23_10875, partial [Acidobacteriota bacterium]